MSSPSKAVDVLAVMDYVIDRACERLTTAQLDEATEAHAAIAALIQREAAMRSVLQSFVANIDEWDGEPTPGLRWHKEYFDAKAALSTIGESK